MKFSALIMVVQAQLFICVNLLIEDWGVRTVRNKREQDTQRDENIRGKQGGGQMVYKPVTVILLFLFFFTSHVPIIHKNGNRK